MVVSSSVHVHDKRMARIFMRFRVLVDQNNPAKPESTKELVRLVLGRGPEIEIGLPSVSLSGGFFNRSVFF